MEQHAVPRPVSLSNENSKRKVMGDPITTETKDRQAQHDNSYNSRIDADAHMSIPQKHMQQNQAQRIQQHIPQQTYQGAASSLSRYSTSSSCSSFSSLQASGSSSYALQPPPQPLIVPSQPPQQPIQLLPLQPPAPQEKCPQVPRPLLRRRNSTNSMLLNGTLSEPNMNDVLRGGSVMLSSLVWLGEQQGSTFPFAPDHGPLDERRYIHMPFEYDPRSQQHMSTRELGQCTEDHVYEFLSNVFRKAKLPPENMVIALILMSRIVSLNNIRVNRCTWSVLTLQVLFMSHKLMLDMNICNSWLSAVWMSCVNGATSAFSPAVVRKLEKYIMSLIDFNAYVSGAQYSQVYFEILALVPPPRMVPRTVTRADSLLAERSCYASTAGGSGVGQRNTGALVGSGVSVRRRANSL